MITTEVPNNRTIPEGEVPAEPNQSAVCERGSILLPIVVLMVAIGTIGGSAVLLLSSDLEGQQASASGDRAFYLAESGARYAIKRLATEGQTAMDDMNGRQYTLANGTGFELNIESEVLGSTIRYYIDATGFSGLQEGAQRQSLNGYTVEISEQQEASSSPVAFPKALQVLGETTISLGGGSYVDSYDSTDPDAAWSYAGEFSNGNIQTNLSEDAVQLGGGAYIYGDLIVGSDADLDDPSSIINAPDRVLGDTGITIGGETSVDAVPAPEEPAEIALEIPTTFENAPAISWDTPTTFSGGNYSTSGDFTTSWRDLTFTSDTFFLTGETLEVGSGSLTINGDFGVSANEDLKVASGGTLTVDGDFEALVNEDLKINGNSVAIGGDADIQVVGDAKFASDGNMTVAGTLDLDVVEDFDMAGGASLTVGGNVDIDVSGEFEMSGGAELNLNGDTIIRAEDGFTVSGGAVIDLGETGSVKVYVEDGDIEIKSGYIAPEDFYQPVRFQVFGSEDVEQVKITSGGSFIGTIYAPNAEVVLSGGVQFFGAIVAESISAGGGVGIHFDESLMNLLNTTDPDLLRNLRDYWVAAGGE